MRKIKKTISALLVCVFFACLVNTALFAETGKVNINTDSKEILMTLKHVGEKLADRIIEYRKDHAFTKPEEIMNVKGIGSKVFEANKNRIVVKSS